MIFIFNNYIFIFSQSCGVDLEDLCVVVSFQQDGMVMPVASSRKQTENFSCNENKAESIVFFSLISVDTCYWKLYER